MFLVFLVFLVVFLSSYPVLEQKMDLKKLKDLVTEHIDFPKKGILFYDVLPIFRDPLAFETLLTHLTHHVMSQFDKIDVVVGLESRGFIVAPSLALRLGAAFVPLRKPGKLPGKTISAEFAKEYGTVSCLGPPFCPHIAC